MPEPHPTFTDTFRAFVTRHDHLFTVLGAFLVVAAFYTQDVKLPPLVKSSADIHAATTESVDLAYINSKMSDLSVQLNDGFQPERSKSPFVNQQRNIVGASRDFDAAQDDLRLAEIITGRLPIKRAELTAKGKEIESMIAGLRVKESAMLSDLDAADLASVKGTTDTSKIPGYDKLMTEAMSFVKESGTFNKSVTQFQTAVTNEANDQLEALDTKSERWQHISEFLVILGFITGLLSKFLKLPTLGGE